MPNSMTQLVPATNFFIVGRLSRANPGKFCLAVATAHAIELVSYFDANDRLDALVHVMRCAQNSPLLRDTVKQEWRT